MQSQNVSESYIVSSFESLQLLQPHKCFITSLFPSAHMFLFSQIRWVNIRCKSTLEELFEAFVYTFSIVTYENTLEGLFNSFRWCNRGGILHLTGFPRHFAEHINSRIDKQNKILKVNHPWVLELSSHRSSWIIHQVRMKFNLSIRAEKRCQSENSARKRKVASCAQEQSYWLEANNEINLLFKSMSLMI